MVLEISFPKNIVLIFFKGKKIDRKTNEKLDSQFQGICGGFRTR
jgi:hypothetical protein